ncbi:MAG: putative DNA-binding domain-containing protein [Bdellovibrionales bacterium]|nr:putative DNA-binding domain-containing protein [Bdellovibrionales bacterium]
MSKFNTLVEVQHRIQDSIKEKSLHKDLLELVIEKPPMSIVERMKIYQNAYYIRLTESLKEDFLRVQEVISTDIFFNLISEFINENPSRTRNLAEYSSDFPEFIKIKKPELYELALKDWLEILVDYQDDPESVMDAEDIKDGKKFNILTHSSAIWKKLNNSFLFAYRRQDEIIFEEIPEYELSILSFLKNGKSIEELGKYAVEISFSEEKLMLLVRNWTSKGVLFCKAVD